MAELDGLDTRVAIVGIAARFPGAGDAAAYWRNLRNGVDSISTFSKEDLVRGGVPRDLVEDPSYVPAKGVLEGADRFDAGLFGYSPREAQLTDPQQRVFLECCWAALEDAGHDPDRFPGTIGVYGGARLGTYAFELYRAESLGRPVDDLPFLLGNDKDYLTTRVSYALDLRGPSLVVQSACSTSLVAALLAYQSLVGFSCDLALAGGVRVSVPLRCGYLFSEEGIVSPDGRCRAFDARAAGTVFSDGVGVVAMRRLEDALADGDPIYAVIRGGAINNDGRGKLAWTAPSGSAQAEVIAMALESSGVHPDEISYVEAHGTGTKLGDPIEIEGLTKAFRAQTRRSGYCGVGSVKANIGHASAAAGIASLIKVALALHHRELPPSIHYATPNPEIDFAATPFYVNTELRRWSAPGPLRAGVSSFGMGGTNAHVILEEAPFDV